MTPQDALLTCRTAIVTGAGAGIGKGIALALARFGARVALLEIDPATCARTADEIRAAGGEALPIPTDVRDGEAVERAVATTAERTGRLDVLVNNAGGTFAAPFLESKEKGWDALLRANLRSVFSCTQAVARRMADGGLGGSIINIVSIEGVRAAPGYAPYAAAKAGVVNFTQTTAVELGPHGIRVNAIAPDVCMTEGLRAMIPEGDRERFRWTVPLGRAAEPDDIAGAAVFLASDLARYVTGVTLHVDGGTHAAGGWYRDPADGAWTLGPPRRR
ncbi:MAG TPA: glucose 1-dehydrogenase [Candidatus Eisenbacteria bacterium]|nr:glucose 1-dehydrogenase [Candidatus Eisenbacteria bacterium]